MKHFAVILASLLAASTHVNASQSSRMGWIPAQTFTMGDATGGGWPDQEPAHTVTLSAFYIAPSLVTVQEYCDFLNSSRWDAEEGTFIVRKEGGEVLVNFAFLPITKAAGRSV